MKTVQLYVRRIFNLNGELIRFTMIELLMRSSIKVKIRIFALRCKNIGQKTRKQPL